MRDHLNIRKFCKKITTLAETPHFITKNGRFYECIMSIVNKLLPVNPLGVCLPEVTVRGDNTLETTPGITP